MLAAAMSLAAGTQAYAIVLVTPPVNLPAALGTTATRGWDVDGNGVRDFTFQFRFPNSTGASGVVWQANMNPMTSLQNAVVGYLGASLDYGTCLAFVQPLGPGAPAGASFRTAAQVMLASVYRSGGVPSGYGGFYPGNPNIGSTEPGRSRGFAGFRIGSGAAARYGWVDLRVTHAGIEFYTAALGSVGETVATGFLGPESTSLAALALGATVFLRVRRTTPKARNA